VTSVVLSVPPYYNQAARRALMTACEIAEINVMRFIGSPSSISLNYGVFRRKEFTPEERHIVFYDMGSSATKAAVATFFTAKDKESKMKVPHVEIRGLG
jgi:hypoxia up-regulated 1